MFQATNRLSLAATAVRRLNEQHLFSYHNDPMDDAYGYYGDAAEAVFRNTLERAIEQFGFTVEEYNAEIRRRIKLNYMRYHLLLA